MLQKMTRETRTSSSVVVRRIRAKDGSVRRVKVRDERKTDLTRVPWTRGTLAAKALVQRMISSTVRFADVVDGKIELNATLELRDYQEQAVRDSLHVVQELVQRVRLHALNNGLGEPNPVPLEFCRVIMPPRTGKRIIFGHIAAAMGIPTLVLTGSTSLASDHCRDLQEQFPDLAVGLYTGDEKRQEPLGITCSTYSSLQLAHAKGEMPVWMRNIQLVIADEGHVSMTPKRMAMLREVFHWTALRIAFTATPDYSHDKVLADHFPRLIKEITLQEARRQDMIADLRCWVVEVDEGESSVSVKSGRYDPRQLEALMSDAPYFRTCEILRWHTADNANIPALICCGSRQQAWDLYHYLCENRPEGRDRPRLILGNTPTHEREESKLAFRAGRCNTLITVGVLIQGWTSLRCKLMIDLAPTLSMVRAKQKWFRILTKFLNLEARLYLVTSTKLSRTPLMPVEVFGRSVVERDFDRFESAFSEIAKARGVKVPKLRRRGRIQEVDAKTRYRRWSWLIDPQLDPYNRRAIRNVIESQFVIREYAPPPLSIFKSRWFEADDFEGSGRMLLRYCGRGLRGQDYDKFMAWLYPHFIGDMWIRKKTGVKQIRRDDRPNIDDDVRHILENVPRHPAGMPLGWRALFGPESSVSPEETVSYRELIDRAARMLATLTPRQERVLQMRFGLDHVCEYDLEEVARDFGVTRERIRQVEAKGLRKLRHPSREKHLRPFVGR